MESTWQQLHTDESGSAAVIMSLMLTGMLMLAAMVLDLGHLATVHSEARKAAEAGAIAGARALALPKGVGYWNWDNGKNIAVATVKQNFIDLHSLGDFTTTNVQVGYWDMSWDSRLPHDLLSPNIIAPVLGQVAAVKVTVAKKQGGSGSSAPMPTFFASVMGVTTMATEATAVAMISPITTIPYSGAFPFAIPYTFVDQHWADNPPTIFRVATAQQNTSGGQWTSFKTTDNSASYVDGLILGSNTTDSLNIGDEIYIQTGEKSSIYNTVRDNEIGQIRMVPVVPDGFQVGAYTTIKAYVPFKITGCSGSGSNPYVEGHFVPGYIDPKASGAGGKNFGDLLPPKLVQ